MNSVATLVSLCLRTHSLEHHMVLGGPQLQGPFPMTSPSPVFPPLPPVEECKEKFSQECDIRFLQYNHLQCRPASS